MSMHELPRERAVLEFLAEHRLGIAPQVGALLQCSPGVAQQQLRALGAVGRARSERIFAGRPSTWRITAAGLRAVGSPLTPPRLDLSHYAHDLGLGWLWLAARSGSFGELAALHSERAMRSHDARADARGDHGDGVGLFGVGVGTIGSRGREQRHYPDLLLDTGTGRRIAIELELSGKSALRLASIMLSYAGDTRVDSVLYLVPDRRLAARIAGAAHDAGAARLVHVQPLTGAIEGAVAGAHRHVDRTRAHPPRLAR
jgi:hypothetical protein